MVIKKSRSLPLQPCGSADARAEELVTEINEVEKLALRRQMSLAAASRAFEKSKSVQRRTPFDELAERACAPVMEDTKNAEQLSRRHSTIERTTQSSSFRRNAFPQSLRKAKSQVVRPKDLPNVQVNSRVTNFTEDPVPPFGRMKSNSSKNGDTKSALRRTFSTKTLRNRLSRSTLKDDHPKSGLNKSMSIANFSNNQSSFRSKTRHFSEQIAKGFRSAFRRPSKEIPLQQVHSQKTHYGYFPEEIAMSDFTMRPLPEDEECDWTTPDPKPRFKPSFSLPAPRNTHASRLASALHRHIRSKSPQKRNYDLEMGNIPSANEALRNELDNFIGQTDDNPHIPPKARGGMKVAALSKSSSIVTAIEHPLPKSNERNPTPLSLTDHNITRRRVSRTSQSARKKISDEDVPSIYSQTEASHHTIPIFAMPERRESRNTTTTDMLKARAVLHENWAAGSRNLRANVDAVFVPSRVKAWTEDVAEKMALRNKISAEGKENMSDVFL